MKPATRRAVLAGLHLAAAVLKAATCRARSTGASSGAGASSRPGALETRRRPDGVWEAVL